MENKQVDRRWLESFRFTLSDALSVSTNMLGCPLAMDDELDEAFS
ncbi:hypothetical protein Chor_001657, partial [Crotalus horridus]